MKSATEWFEHYAESHQNPLNKKIHWICIPVILVTTLGLMQSIPHPFGEQQFILHWGSLFVMVSLGFYFRLSWTLGLGMCLVSAIALGLNAGIAFFALPLAQLSALFFALAWVLQFVGHRIEGKKPSFFEDLQFLLIGPAWLLQFIYQKIGIRIETRGT